MKNKRSSTNWLIDAALFGSVIALFFLELTGVALHQWLGIAAGALAFYHLVVHWEWVKAVTRRFLGRTTWEARLYLLVDVLLFSGLGAILVSGLLISTWLNVPLGRAAAAWANFHVVTSQATLALIVLKLALHWRWIVKTARRIVSLPMTRAADKPATMPSGMATREVGRRDFAKLMGVVGAAAALALFQTSSQAAAASLQVTSARSGSAAQAVEAQSTPFPASKQRSSGATLCTKLCPKGRSCNYPGRCRQYVDRNRNGHCDLAEC